MISTSEAYKAAITADARRMRVKCVVDLVGPDIVYGAVVSSTLAPWSKTKELHNKVMVSDAQYSTLERNRWILDGSFDILPDGYGVPDETGAVSSALSGADGYFGTPQYAEMRFSGVYVLQACSVYFSDNDSDGIPRDFAVEIYSGGVPVYSESFTDNVETSVELIGFTVYQPSAIRVTVTRMSSPSRRLRLLEIVPGMYAEWTEDDLAEFTITQQAAFSNLALPYSTCVLKMDNLDRRFDPRNKFGIFLSLSERQAVTTYIGVDTANGTEYVCTGIYYFSGSGWKDSENSIAMQWRLVDIVGLLNDREFVLSGALPTTLGGWVQQLVLQFGTNFGSRFHVDPEYSGLRCTVKSYADVDRKKCGQILLWICQATGTWPRADAETGRLTIEPFWDQGVVLDLDNLEKYPSMGANNDIARLDFTLSDDAGTVVSFTGTNAAAPRGANISNPFVHDKETALKAARMMLSSYGGNIIETLGRGDPSSEIGDVATVQLDGSTATTGRVMFQTFQFRSGVMRACKTQMLQADGAYLYQNRVLLTGSGTFVVPPGVTMIRAILGQGGQGGGHGADGALGTPGSYFDKPSDGEKGKDGSGGKIYYVTIGVNPGQEFPYAVGAGGKAGVNSGDAGALGGETIFGAYSSADGEIYPNGFTDISGGSSYGRSAVELPLPNSSDGAKGGAGGEAGYRHREYTGNTSGLISYLVTDKEPTPGEKGADGGDGFILIYYDDPESEVSA